MSEERRRYTSYLLRLWQVLSKDGLVWRASLEQASTGERQGFTSLADLFVSVQGGSEDLHLQPNGHSALNAGLDLSGSVDNDIDEDARFQKHADRSYDSDSFISAPLLLSVPIQFHQKTLGVINFNNKQKIFLYRLRKKLEPFQGV